LDFNYFYHRHQVSLFMSEHAASEPAKQAHRGLARLYESRIAAARQARREACCA
jgi:hypothetical protein